MPFFDLLFSAELSGAEAISRQEGAAFMVEFSCGKCSTFTKTICFMPGAEVAIPGSRGTADLVYTCKGCNNTSNIIIVKESPYKGGDLKSVATLEVRGSLIPLSWRFGAASVHCVSGVIMPFDDNDSAFCGYDDENEAMVEVMDIRHSVS